ncbi:hypothetical protein [uncultured Methanobrevibacter sp.]|nr:hypothetical protein [uncultured Methanobrevibacter sp.]
MILELVFIIGLITGLVAGLIVFYLLFREDFKALDEFEERQEKYRKMI